MTLMGISISQDVGVIWADSAVTAGGQPCGHMAKLWFNPLALVAGVGGGMAVLAKDAHSAVIAGEHLPGILRSVAFNLRRAAMRVAGSDGELPDSWLAQNAFYTVGWDDQQERIAAYEFLPESFFRPRRMTVATWPRIDVPFRVTPWELAVVRDLAAQQAAMLRADGYAVGKLIVATISRHGIVSHAPTQIPSPDDGQQIAQLEAPWELHHEVPVEA